MQRALNLVLSVFYWKTFKTYLKFFLFLVMFRGKIRSTQNLDTS